MKKVAAFIASGSGMGADAAKHLSKKGYEIAIMSSVPELNADLRLGDLRNFGIDFDIDSDFDPGFASDFNVLDIRDVDATETEPGFSGFNVPAPGAITLLALAGLSRRRRRR